ncbi:hypothetical protein ABTK20_23015, partial [Acinetobacter baumannii]
APVLFQPADAGLDFLGRFIDLLLIHSDGVKTPDQSANFAELGTDGRTNTTQRLPLGSCYQK